MLKSRKFPNQKNSYTCKCGACSVDEGNSYLKRGYTNSDNDFTELSEYEVCEKA